MTDWISVKDRLPRVGKYVRAAAPSGYVGYPWRYFTANCDPSYKGWVTVGNTRITDYGEDVEFWCELDGPEGERK